MLTTEERKVEFEGVVTGVATAVDAENIVCIQGKVNDYEGMYYVAVDNEMYRKIADRGVGYYIRGEGVVLKRNPLTIKATKLVL